MTKSSDTSDIALQGLLDGMAWHAKRWASQQSGHAQIAAAAITAVVHAHLEGHTCISLDSLAKTLQVPSATGLTDALLQSGVVQRGVFAQSRVQKSNIAQPLVLDDWGHVYLHRNFDHERRLALQVAQRLRAPSIQPSLDVQASMVSPSASHAQAFALSSEQRGVVQRSLTRSLSVITGGPGTGKTTTVVHLLGAWLRQRPQLRIALAAPTGKAAARMMEAVRQHSQGWPAELTQGLPTSGHTLHRLLGAGPRGFAHHAQRPLALDVLVVDEASMLDLALARCLFDALPACAHLVLLGDKDQLASVEAGSVFADLCGSGSHVERLTQNFRFGEASGIAEWAHHIRLGDEAAVFAALPRFQAAPLDVASQATQGFAAYVQAVHDHPHDAARALAALEQFRVLCAVREGPRGVHALNQQLTMVLAPAMRGAASAPGASPSSQGSAWYVGRPVLVTRNEPRLGLYNGDVGVTLPNDRGQLRVWFASGDQSARDGTADKGLRAFHPAQLPTQETAWAMTVHRAQGSEFERLLVILPEQESRVVTREWLYTAVTRARTQLQVVASESVLRAGLGTSLQRHSGLPMQLARAQGAMAET